MKIPLSLPPLLAILAICSAPVLQAQSVTWGATGLPPGMSVSSVNGTTAKISGTPTAPGNYKAIVFPKIGNVIGDMASVPITVLPPGLSLPNYYGYTRQSGTGYSFSPLAGGSGYIFGTSYLSGNTQIPLFTTNGTIFTEPTLPTGVNPFVNGSPQAAIAGSRCLVLGNGALAYSDNRGAFKALPSPSGIDSGWSSGIEGNGANRFFYVNIASIQNPTNYTSSNVMKIYSMQNNQTTWTSRGTFSVTNSSYNAQTVSVAVNGSFVVMAVSEYSSPIRLLFSTNGGDTWTVNNSNSEIASVAYGNGIFLGTGNNGVWKSTNGINWTKISSTYVGNIIHSSREGLFFTISGGVSKDGVYWMGYPDMWGGTTGSKPVSSGTGALFLPGGQQLSTTYIPSFYAGMQRSANVGTATSFTLQLDSAGSGSVSQ